MTSSTRIQLKLSAAPLAIGLSILSAPVMLATPTMAQDTSVAPADVAPAAEEPQTIIVTGSRIQRRDLEGSAPMSIVSSQEFKLSGAVNVEQVVNTLPQVLPGSTSFSNNPGGGVATLDLRGLGASRTLVLVNGRRWMFYDTSQLVDLNTIPAFLLDGVDVVTGGASAVYGSDAIAGVVNFRLKNVQGLEGGAQYNVSGHGDGNRYEAYLAAGSEFAEGRGHATVYAEYYKRSDVFAGARSFSDTVLGDDGSGGFIPGGSSTVPYGRFTSTLSSAACPAGNVFCSPGAVYRTPGVSSRRTGTDLYNFGPVNYLMVPQERYLIGGYADYDVGGGHTAYIETTFVNNRVDTQLAATPVTGTFNVNIAKVAPFISAADAASLAAIDAIADSGNVVGDGIVPLAVQRRVTETGGRISADERNAFRLLVGIRGPITDRFSYDAYYSYARTRNSQVQYGNISRSAFQAGLDGTAAPINIFGENTLSRAMVDQISILAQNGEVSTLQVADASINGSLFNLGMGAEDVGIAFGGEYRKVSSQFIPDTALSSGDVIGFNAGDATAGSYNVKELFGEIRVPIVADRPGIYRLDVNGAARYSDYSLKAVGSVWTYAAGADYSPIRDITLRGQYQRAVRAPNVAELFGGQAQNFPPATDPCAVPANAANPTIANLCVLTGVPASAVGSPSLQLNTQIQDLEGGNPNLDEEVSDSYTAGVVFRPSFFPGFSVTADWFKIKVKGAVDTLGGGLNNTLNLCYNQIQDINSPYCQVFLGTRNALGQFDGTTPPQILNANTGALKVEGVDLQVDYTSSLPFALMGAGESQINFFFLGTYTKNRIIVPVAALPDTFINCAGKFGLTCTDPTPKYKWTTRISWIDGPVTTSFRWRHLSSVRDDDDSTDYTVEKLPSYDLFDLSFAVDATDALTLNFGVDNLFDKKPPLIGDNQEQTNTYPSTYDVLGRDFFVSGRLRF